MQRAIEIPGFARVPGRADYIIQFPSLDGSEKNGEIMARLNDEVGTRNSAVVARLTARLWRENIHELIDWPPGVDVSSLIAAS
jgi:hypothetical protein